MSARFSVASDLIDLRLKIVNHLGGHRIAQDVEEIDALIAGYLLVGAQLDALLHVLYLRILRYQQRLLRLPYGLVRVGSALSRLWLALYAQHGEQQRAESKEDSHFDC